MTEMKLGENIRSLRKEKGIGQDILASQLGVTVQAVSKWETGGSMPDITLLPQIAEYFGVTIEELFYGRKESTEPAAPVQAETELVVLPVLAEDAADTAAEQSPEQEQTEFSEEKPDAAWETDAHQEESHSERPQYGWNDLENLGRTISDSVSEQFKKIKENFKGNSFDFRFFHNDRWARENDVRDDLPDDQVLRVVQFIGNQMISADEVTDDQPIRLHVEDIRRTRLDVQVYGSAVLTGGVGGSVTADGYVKCGGVGGNVTSDESVECKSVGGSVTADGNVNCGNVGGRVAADGDVNCGAVMGSVSADGDVHCGHVSGPVRCDGNVYQTK